MGYQSCNPWRKKIKNIITILHYHASNIVILWEQAFTNLIPTNYNFIPFHKIYLKLKQGGGLREEVPALSSTVLWQLQWIKAVWAFKLKLPPGSLTCPQGSKMYVSVVAMPVAPTYNMTVSSCVVDARECVWEWMCMGLWMLVTVLGGPIAGQCYTGLFGLTMNNSLLLGCFSLWPKMLFYFQNKSVVVSFRVAVTQTAQSWAQSVRKLCDNNIIVFMHFKTIILMAHK